MFTTIAVPFMLTVTSFFGAYQVNSKMPMIITMTALTLTP